MVINNKQLYKITLTREQLMLISRCVEDISRYAAGDMDLQHTTETLIDDMDRTESLGIRSFIANNSMAIRRRLFPDLEDYEHIGYDGGSKDMINRKRLIGNTYQIYRSILHQLAIDENWNNVYSDMTLPSGDMGTIEVERVDYYCDSNNKRNANRKPNIGMIKEYMDFIEYMNNDEDEEEKIVYDTILMIGDASGKEGQFSDSDKKTAENFGCEYMDVDDFVDKYKG